MQKLRVLIHDIGIPIPEFDYRQSGAKGLYPLLQELHKLFEVEEIWIYQKGGSKLGVEDKNSNKYYAFTFRDGLDIIDYLRPDLILTRSDYEFLTRSIILAARYRGIPTVVLLSIRPYKEDMDNHDLIGTIKAKLSWLKANGRNITKRYLFLLRTQSRIRLSWYQNLKTIASDFQLTFKTYEPAFRLGYGDLYICNNTGWSGHLIRHGINKSKITIAGECALDLTFDRLRNMKPKEKAAELKILFITTSMVEHSIWTPAMRDNLVTRVLESLFSTFIDVNVTMKIQPGEPLEHYRRMVQEISSIIEVFETGDLLSMIYEADIIVSMASTTALFEAVLLNKPIFVMNLYNDQSRGFLVTKKVVTPCKSPEELVDNIKNARHLQPSQDIIDNFIEEQVFKFDGKCSERAAKSIQVFLEKRPIGMQVEQEDWKK